MADPITTTLTLTVLKPILNGVAKSANLFFSEEFKKRFQLHKFSINNTQLVESVEKIGLVKTLFTGAEKPVEISTFFYLPSITTTSGINRINSINEISTSHSILIEATVGQGKSILMRYLALQEVAQNSRIPIFIELKNISKEKNLHALIREKILAWTSTDITDEQIKFIFRSGKISIFLDAFDEISKDYTSDTLTYIENLANNYSDLKLVVSSRPEHEIKFSNFFETIQVNSYDREDQKALINILVKDNDARITLLSSIENSSPEIQKLLTTPLMIGLYIKKFNTDFSPPENITSFYKNIFEVVATTHDRTKGGYTRQSSSCLKQDKLEQIFERFCFECYKLDKTSFEKTEVIEILENSLDRLRIGDCSGSQVLDDFCDYLCLIVRDGLNFTFIHRSIYEYYVALFFSKLSVDNAERVIPRINQFNILIFLKHLNLYYFNLFYLKDKLLNFFEKFNKGSSNYNTRNVLPLDFLKIFSISKDIEDHISINSSAFDYLRNSEFIFKEFIAPIFKHINNKYNVPLVAHTTNTIVDNINETKTNLLHSQFNNDKVMKILFEKIFITYDSLVDQIESKKNEITCEDFENL